MLVARVRPASRVAGSSSGGAAAMMCMNRSTAMNRRRCRVTRCVTRIWRRPVEPLQCTRRRRLTAAGHGYWPLPPWPWRSRPHGRYWPAQRVAVLFPPMPRWAIQTCRAGGQAWSSTSCTSSVSNSQVAAISTGGTVVYLSPGVGVSVSVAHNTQLFAVVQLPLYSRLTGYQLFPHWTASVGASYAF